MSMTTDAGFERATALLGSLGWMFAPREAPGEKIFLLNSAPSSNSLGHPIRGKVTRVLVGSPTG
jgi:hypothetical protein